MRSRLNEKITCEVADKVIEKVGLSLETLKLETLKPVRKTWVFTLKP